MRVAIGDSIFWKRGMVFESSGDQVERLENDEKREYNAVGKWESQLWMRREHVGAGRGQESMLAAQCGAGGHPENVETKFEKPR